MMTCSAARSHSETSGSADISAEPSATSTCDQKSPNPLVRHTERVRERNPSSRPCSSQPVRLEYDSDASQSLDTSETWHRVALVKDRPVQVPAPVAAHQRRPRAGAETTPTTTASPSISPIRVAQTGTPRT